ncbi:unnamed protein product [Mucor hiemalis]
MMLPSLQQQQQQHQKCSSPPPPPQQQLQSQHNYKSISPMLSNNQKENDHQLLKRKGPGRPTKGDMIEKDNINSELQITKRLKTMHCNNNNNNDPIIKNNEMYYSSCVGNQVIVYKQQQQDYYYGWPPDQASWISYNLVDPNSVGAKYGPRGKELKASWQDYKTFYYSTSGVESRKNTGLVSDAQMNLHQCPCQSQEVIHPERPDRISYILDSLHSKRLLRHFRRIHTREVTSNELLRVHTFSHVRNYYPLLSSNKDKKPIKITSIAALLNYSPPTSPTIKHEQHSVATLYGVAGGDEYNTVKIEQPLDTRTTSVFSPPDLLYKMNCGELGIAVDTTYHPMYSRTAAKLSAGGLIELSDSIVKGELKNGFALIRPPGHHAEDDAAMGYCFYNNVAVAVSAIMHKHSDKIKKVLIIDWDIHHGNGTQKIFYDNPNVLYISVHRWEHGKFYPFSGAPDECGQSEGLGLNVNIAMNESKEKPKSMGDTEFVAAFYHLLIPIARQFEPDMIFVSAGFDAAEGHPENIGGYCVTPKGFSLMTKIVCDLAKELCEDRLVLSLEGGYELQSLANSATASIIQLLSNNTIYKHSLNGIKPNLGAIESFRTIVNIQKKYWNLLPTQPNFKFQLPFDWKARDSISTRPKRDKRRPSASSSSTTVVEGY